MSTFANPLHSAALAAYPVGSIYMSTNATSPAILFGGTWERILGKFLFAADSSRTAGSTGGESEHKLTQDELPKISGGIGAASGPEGATGGGYGAFRQAAGVFTVASERQYGQPKEYGSWPGSSAYGDIQLAFGGDQPHNNMPPYLAVYMWQRTA